MGLQPEKTLVNCRRAIFLRLIDCILGSFISYMNDLQLLCLGIIIGLTITKKMPMQFTEFSYIVKTDNCSRIFFIFFLSLLKTLIAGTQ